METTAEMFILYEFDEVNNTYIEKWDYKVGGGGTSVWTVGLGVSGDGSTVAVGTLILRRAGGYDGEMYVFNSWSPVPLMDIFSGAGDEISSISISEDGSLIAAAGWGPLDHSKPDFFLFRKQSSSPIIRHINTLDHFISVRHFTRWKFVCRGRKSSSCKRIWKRWIFI